MQAQASTLSVYDPLWDVEVLRNVTIQRTAEGLKEISQLYQAQRYQEAWNLAHRLEADLRAVAALTGEKQMAADADLMRRYQETLAQWVRRQTGRGPEDTLAPEPPASIAAGSPRSRRPCRCWTCSSLLGRRAPRCPYGARRPEGAYVLCRKLLDNPPDFPRIISHTSMRPVRN